MFACASKWTGKDEFPSVFAQLPDISPMDGLLNDVTRPRGPKGNDCYEHLFQCQSAQSLLINFQKKTSRLLQIECFRGTFVLHTDTVATLWLCWNKSKTSATMCLLDFNVAAWARVKAAKSAASSSVCTFKYSAYYYVWYVIKPPK